MNTQLLLEEEHNILKNRLTGNLKRKHVLELKITEQFEQLKRMEILMEKNSQCGSRRKTGAYLKDGRK